MTALAPASQETTPSQPPVQKRKFGGAQPVPVDGRKHRHRPKTNIMLVRRQDLDQRSLAARDFDAQVSAITADLGHDLTAIEKQMVENFAGISTLLNDMLVQILLGQKVDTVELCALNTASVRIASRLGLRRRAKDVTTPSLGAYLSEREPDDSEGQP
jgi:hypothetical protein